MSRSKYDRMSLGALKDAAAATSRNLRVPGEKRAGDKEKLHADLNDMLDEIRRREKGQ